MKRRPPEVGEYDDDQAVRSYIASYWRWHMTDFERRCQYLGTRREKAEADPDTSFAERVRSEWARNANASVRLALSPGYAAFMGAVKERVLNEFESGSLVVNRCPHCRRVVRTPQSEQCLWCGHDWHHGPA